jgi:hypothetical protein
LEKKRLGANFMIFLTHKSCLKTNQTGIGGKNTIFLDPWNCAIEVNKTATQRQSKQLKMVERVKYYYQW